MRTWSLYDFKWEIGDPRLIQANQTGGGGVGVVDSFAAEGINDTSQDAGKGDRVAVFIDSDQVARATDKDAASTDGQVGRVVGSDGNIFIGWSGQALGQIGKRIWHKSTLTGMRYREVVLSLLFGVVDFVEMTFLGVVPIAVGSQIGFVQSSASGCMDGDKVVHLSGWL
jgi:hypothetical protein